MKKTQTIKKQNKQNSKYITEKEADKILKPYLIRLVKRIENGDEELISWEDVKKELKKS